MEGLSPDIWVAIRLTIELATITTVILLMVGMVLVIIFATLVPLLQVTSSLK